MKIFEQRRLRVLGLIFVVGLLMSGLAAAQAEEPDTQAASEDASDEDVAEISDEDRATMALDSTAT